MPTISSPYSIIYPLFNIEVKNINLTLCRFLYEVYYNIPKPV